MRRRCSSITGLVKRFGENTAVDGISLDVRAGSFFGIVGPNGAGKTTTLSMVTGLLRPDAGAVSIHGIDAWADPRAAKRATGVLPDRLRLFDRLTGAQLLYYSGVLRGLDARTVRERSADLIAAFGLEDAVDRLVADYSAGMTKKIALACAMIHSPRLLVLDEPFESVDPVSAANLTEILERYVAGGGTVVLSSHGMDLIERVCDSAAIIVGGRVLASGKPRRGPCRADPRRPFRRARGRAQGCGRHGMVAQFLRLKLRLLATSSVAAPGRSSASSSGSSTGWASRRCCSRRLVGLRFVDDVEHHPRRAHRRRFGDRARVHRASRWCSAVDDTMDPRRFALFGLPDRTLALGLAVAALVGIPALVLAIVLLGTVVTWSRGIAETLLAILSAALAFAHLPAASPGWPQRSRPSCSRRDARAR